MAIDIHNLLAESLLELCEQKPLSSITIKDLLSHTGVSRQAFYNRFRDKNDLIQWIYEKRILKSFIENGYETSYYDDILLYFQAIRSYRSFLKQACSTHGQNCLVDFMQHFAIEYDKSWHQHLNGGQPLSDEQLFVSKYYSVASIYITIEWILSTHPESPELIARRLTQVRSASMMQLLFDNECDAYNYPDC